MKVQAILNEIKGLRHATTVSNKWAFRSFWNELSGGDRRTEAGDRNQGGGLNGGYGSEADQRHRSAKTMGVGRRSG